MTLPIDQSRLAENAARLVDLARRAGASEAEVVAATGLSLGVDVRDGAVEETDRSEGDDVTLRVFVGKRVASVSANAFGDGERLAERAVAMARAAPEDPYAGLAPEEDLLKDAFPDLELLDTTSVAAEALVERARAAEAAALGVSGVSKSGGAHASWSISGLVLVTSNGFSGGYLASGESL